MEPNGLGGGMFSSINSGLLGVENQLQQQQQQQNLSNPQNPHPMHHSQMVSYASSHHETDIPQAPSQQSIKHGYPYSAKINQQMALSDDDEASFAAEDNVSSGDKRKVSQWHRMKWTDTMVKLLIMAVFYIGDEGGSEGADKKKPAGLLQKKGKWKSVSRAMMEKGFFVSPQQCEDKFNDLNKRYKRVNDILGKGTACLVVENHSLLETMDLSPKRKEEVRKLLNSKHLFFKEMCAYHNSCGHGGTACGPPPPPQQSPEVGTEPSQATQPQQQHQRCSHSSEVGMVNLGKPESEGLKISKEVSREEDEDDDEDDESEDSSDEDEEESGEGVSGGHKTGRTHEDEDENYEGRPLMKRARKEEMCSSSKLMQETSNEVMGMLQDGGRSAWEKRQWMKRKVMQLEEQQLRYEVEAFELEKQRLKWARFSSKKEREMERAKLENQRRQLENERMVLLLRQKDLELLSQSSPSPKTTKQQQQHSCN